MPGTSSYPSSLDTFVNPNGSDSEQTLDHAGIHTHVNDAAAAIQATLGVIGDTDTSTILNRLGRLETFQYTQSSASATWTINHNLHRYPSVSVVDSSGRAVVGSVQYIDSDNLTIEFSAAFGGFAYLN